MLLTFRPIKVRPTHWSSPSKFRPRPFSAPYQATLNMLDRELVALGATAVQLQVDADDRHIRLDGQLRADAVVNHPGVILTVETRKKGTLVYETDEFGPWQQNLRAIALGLEALRRVKRYGIARRDEQYAGYRELPAGTPLGPGMTIEEAAALLANGADWAGPDMPHGLITDTTGMVGEAYRQAAKRLHPDAGGDPDLFRRLTEARDLLKAAAS